MSRYGFKPTLPTGTVADAALEGLSIVVGWDNPLQTFFGDVEDANGESIRCTMIDMGEFNVNTVSGLEDLIGYRIPNDIAIKLHNDADNRVEPTPLQKGIGGLLKG